jgi:hypothetical protein
MQSSWRISTAGTFSRNVTSLAAELTQYFYQLFLISFKLEQPFIQQSLVGRPCIIVPHLPRIDIQ